MTVKHTLISLDMRVFALCSLMELHKCENSGTDDQSDPQLFLLLLSTGCYIFSTTIIYGKSGLLFMLFFRGANLFLLCFYLL